MNVAFKGSHPEARALIQELQRRILFTGLLLVFALVFSAVCFPKEVRVPVSPQDVQKASETSNEGDALFERKDFYAALIKYLQAYRLNPNSEYLCNRLGIAYSQLTLYGESIQAFQRAIALNRKYPYPYNNLGSVYFTQKNYKKAEKYFKKAISLNAKEASFHLNLGSLYLEKKKKDRAMAEWKKSYELNPEIFSKRSIASLSSSGSSLSERYFFLARLVATTGNLTATIENLKLAFNSGYTKIEEINKNPDFDLVRKDPLFEKFMQDVAIWLKYQPKDDIRPPLR